ncbi:MAG: 4-hydroxythreonine-4-phosphate dehydrogenase PdxA [Pseudomonadota bacterium]
MGDPAGCGPQITVRAWQDRHAHNLPPFFVIADPLLFDGKIPFEIIRDPHATQTTFDRALPILPLKLAEIDTLEAGAPRGAYAGAIIDSIEQAARLCLQGSAAGLVTNPISKAVLYQEGFTFPGHTEFLASLCQRSAEDTNLPVMMLVGGGLRVALATIHVPLLKVMDHLTADSLERTARIVATALHQDFGLDDARIAFTGLNPHAGESGTIGTEERDLINPVAERLRQSGINISDARPADTVFHESLNGGFDAVIAMTHDQGLIPVKTLDMWGGVNTTLGLPIVRTSPDHGTAYDAAKAGTCHPDSLIAAIKLAAELADNRARARG